MPASLKDLRSRIKSVKSTQQITKAMKLVSAAKFGRAQQAVISSRPYAISIADITGRLAHLLKEGSLHPLMEKSASKVALVLAVSSERGLCGGYNSNVIKQTLKTTQALQAEGFKVIHLCIGKKVFQYLNRRRRIELKNHEPVTFVTQEDYMIDPEVLVSNDLISITTPFDKPSYTLAKNLSMSLERLQLLGKIGKLVVVYNKFQSAMSQIPTADPLLPLSDIPGGEFTSEPIFEPNVEELIEKILPKYMTSRIFQILLDANASEHGSRMTAMDNATRNAKEMERKLQITYQRARQAAITKELIEIISGAEAL